MAQQEIGKVYRNALRKIAKMRGKAGFCSKAVINERTFDKLVGEGFAAPHIVIRVQAEIDKDKEPITHDRVKELTAERLGLLPKDLINPAHKSTASDGRQITAYITHKLVTDNYTHIAKLLGFQDHTGAKKAIATIAGRYSVEKELKKIIDQIITKLHQ